MALRSLLLPVVAWLLVTAIVQGEDPVLVSITGPLEGRVGDRVSFEVELVNRAGKPLQSLRVIDYFDAGFHHEASTSPIEQKGTVDLAPGTARRLTLDFLLDEPGRQCHRVVILDQSQRNLGGAQHCVEVAPNPSFTPPPAAPQSTVVAPPIPPSVVSPPASAAAAALPAAIPAPPAAIAAPAAGLLAPATPAAAALELDLSGPAEVRSGDVVKYVAIIRNNGTAPSAPAALEFSWESALSPLEASDGYNLVDSKVSWTIPAIPPKGGRRTADQSPGRGGRRCVSGFTPDPVMRAGRALRARGRFDAGRRRLRGSDCNPAAAEAAIAVRGWAATLAGRPRRSGRLWRCHHACLQHHEWRHPAERTARCRAPVA